MSTAATSSTNGTGGLFSSDYFQKRDKKTGITPAATLACYLGGSLTQTVVDNPVTSFRQLVQNYSRSKDGKLVDPKVATREAMDVFKKSPVGASLSGLGPRVVGVGLKRIPKFGFFLGVAYVMGDDGEPGVVAATAASIFSAYAINPIRMIEKQQRTTLRTTGEIKSVASILQESRAQNFRPLWRGTVPLMAHSFASALCSVQR